MKQYLQDRAREAISYGYDVAKAVLINCAIMPPAVYATAYLLQVYGVVNFDISLGDLFRIPYGSLLMTFVMVGFAEEGLFRYFLQDRLFEKFLGINKYVALVLAAVLFGAAHLSNGFGVPYSIPQSVGAGLSGLYFGYLYRKRGLCFAALTHGFYDILVTLIYVVLR